MIIYKWKKLLSVVIIYSNLLNLLFYTMKTLLLLLCLCIVPAYSIYEKYANFTYEVPLKMNYLSESGSVMIEGTDNGSIYIYNLIRGKFQLKQTINAGAQSLSCDTLRNNTVLIVSTQTSIQYYELDAETNTYTALNSVSMPWILTVKVIPNTDLIFFMGSLTTNNLICYRYIDNSTSPVLYHDFALAGAVKAIDFSANSTLVAVIEDSSFIVSIYEDIGSGFSLLSQFPIIYDCHYLKANQNFTSITIIGMHTVEIYEWSGIAYTFKQLRGYPDFPILISLIIPNTSLIYTGLTDKVVIESTNQTLIQQIYPVGVSQISLMSADESGDILILSAVIETSIYYQCNQLYCITCSGVFFCSLCISGYQPNINGQCELITISTTTTCDNACLDCFSSKCNQCPIFSQQSLFNVSQCELQNDQFSFLTLIIAIFDIVWYYKVKPILFLVNDLWLYEYHKQDYFGTVNIIFQGVRQIEVQKNRLIPLQDLEFVKQMQSWLSQYESYSNQKFKRTEETADLIPSNIVDFLIEGIPLTLIFFLLVKVLFRITFNYRISSYLRPLSFWGYLFVSLFQSNIEFFTFLGFRNCRHLISKCFTDKLCAFVTLLILYSFVLFVICAYPFLRKLYGKLFKYFLTNMFRINGSSQLMATIFCVRPFMQGMIHSFFYENIELQLVFLGLIGATVFLLLATFQIGLDLVKSKLSFMFLSTYFLLSIPMNYLLYLNLQIEKETELFLSIDEFLEILLFARLGSLILSIASEIFLGISCQMNQNQNQKKQVLKQKIKDTQEMVLEPQEQKQKKEILNITQKVSETKSKKSTSRFHVIFQEEI